MLTRNFLLATFSSLFLTMVFFVYFTGMSIYIIDSLGCDTLIAGIMTGTFVAGDIVSRFLLSNRVQSTGVRRSAVLAILLATAISLSYFMTQSIGVLTVVMFFHGFAYGIAETAIYTMAISEIPESKRGRGIGYFMLSNTFASVLGPFISITLQNTGLFTYMFVFGSACCLMALILMSLSRELPLVPARTSGFRISDYIEKSALRVSLVMFLFFFTYSGVLAFVAPYSEEIGIGWYGSIFFIAVSCATLICRLFLGKVYDNYGENVALVPPLLMYVAGMFMVSMVVSGAELLIAGFMMGMMVAMLNTVSQALVVRDIDRSRYSVAISTMSIFWDMSYAIGPVFHGAVVAYYGYSANFFAMAVVASVSFMLYVALVGIPGRRRRLGMNKC